MAQVLVDVLFFFGWEACPTNKPNRIKLNDRPTEQTSKLPGSWKTFRCRNENSSSSLSMAINTYKICSAAELTTIESLRRMASLDGRPVRTRFDAGFELNLRSVPHSIRRPFRTLSENSDDLLHGGALKLEFC